MNLIEVTNIFHRVIDLRKFLPPSFNYPRIGLSRLEFLSDFFSDDRELGFPRGRPVSAHEVRIGHEDSRAHSEVNWRLEVVSRRPRGE